MTVLHVGPPEVELLAGYSEAGVERVVLPLDTEAPDPLADLDRLAGLTAELVG